MEKEETMTATIGVRQDKDGHLVIESELPYIPVHIAQTILDKCMSMMLKKDLDENMIEVAMDFKHEARRWKFLAFLTLAILIAVVIWVAKGM